MYDSSKCGAVDLVLGHWLSDIYREDSVRTQGNHCPEGSIRARSPMVARTTDFVEERE